ncbi:MAG: hypothetical protein JNJ99_10270 [Crocinitomicaceae bacterium]|nr:hypothetical protein [Crocinitomicaceae bacterium]
MLRITIIASILVLFSEEIYPQKTFFIRPVVESKTSFGSTDWKRTSFDDNLFQGDKPFVIKSKDIIWQHNLSPIYLGVYLGMNFFKEQMTLELGYHQDGTSSGFKLDFEKYDSLMGNSAGQISSDAGTSFHRINLNYSYKLNCCKNTRISIWLFGGVSFGFQAKGDPLLNLIPGNTIVQLEPNKFLNVSYGLYTQRNASFLWQLGIGSTYNLQCRGKSSELFTFSIYYLHGKLAMSTTPVIIDIMENGMLTSRYNFNSYGNGSGVLFQFSRKLQLKRK